MAYCTAKCLLWKRLVNVKVPYNCEGDSEFLNDPSRYCLMHFVETVGFLRPLWTSSLILPFFHSRTVVMLTNTHLHLVPWFTINTFTAIVDLSRFNNSCLKSPSSTLIDLTFQSRALRSFSLNQLRNLSLQAGNLHSSFSISSWHYLCPFYSSVCLHCDIMNPSLSLCLEGEWAVSDAGDFKHELLSPWVFK